MLISDLCDFNDAYIVVKGNITLEDDNDGNKRNKNLAFKNNAPFINFISKINGVKIDKLIKTFLIDGESFFYLPVKNEEEAYEKIIDISNNNDYTNGNLLDFGYFKKNCRLIAIDLSKQTTLKDPQQISFIGKLLNTRGATMFFVIEKSEEKTLNFSQNSVTTI